MVLAAWLDAAGGLHVPAVFLFAAALKLSIFVCRNPISPAPFSAKFSTLAMLKVFHGMLCQDLTTVKSAALFCKACVRAQVVPSTAQVFPAVLLGPVSFRESCCPVEEDALAGIFLAPLSQMTSAQEHLQQKQSLSLAVRLFSSPAQGCPPTA